MGGWHDAHLRHPSYVAAREAAPAFARRLGTEAARRGAVDVVKWHPWDGTPAALRPVVVLGDGAKWIWDHVATLFGSERTEIVDWFHASEHLWTVAKELHGEDTAETKAWARTALDDLWRSGPKPVLDWLDATRPHTPAAAAVLKRERGYFSGNSDAHAVLDLAQPAPVDRLPRHRRLNNRAENSLRPVRRRERAMQQFKSAEQAQRFLETFSAVCNHTRPRRHRLSAERYRQTMRQRF